MSLLGAPLEQSDIDEIRQRYPDFEWDVPDEAKFWSRSDLELFFGSKGKLRPRETVNIDTPTCPLLSRIRTRLAEQRVDEATAEYRSFCRHLQERGTEMRLPGAADCVPVAPTDAGQLASSSGAGRAAPLRGPLLFTRPKDWVGLRWNMDFWKREYGSEWWNCQARSPAFERDRRGADSITEEASVSEYVDYARMLHRIDPGCREENAVAYPRLSLDSWCPFCGAARRLFEECWRRLSPAGVRDHSVRWLKVFVQAFNMDWLEYTARYYKVTIGAAGTVSRLHVENHGAHTWFTQIEGRRAFFLFPPQEGRILYEDSGGFCEGPEGYAGTVSPVDIFFPNLKRHPKFAEAKAQVAVLSPGDTLVLPGGWWRYAVALEPSVTLHHPFWNLENRKHLIDELREAFSDAGMPPELHERAAHNFTQIQEQIMDDDDSDMD